MQNRTSLPKVTVLITLYNKGPFVREAVQSVLDQEYQDLELLVVDDASQDEGPAVVRQFDDPRIRLLESPVNTGRAAAANRGYKAARGKYVAVLDADDRMLPGRLEKQVALMEAHPEIGVAGSWIQAFGGSDRCIQPPADDRAARSLELFGMPVMYGSCMIRREVIEKHHIRCEENWLLPGMDRLFILRIGQHARYANLQEFLTSYRIGPQNMRHGRDAVKDRSALDAKVFSLLGIPASPPEVRLHCFLHPEHGQLPSGPVQVWRLYKWIKHLTAMNRKAAIWPLEEFEAELQVRWQRLFHALVEKDACGAFAHALLNGSLGAQFGYWAKVTKDRWAGRKITHRPDQQSTSS